jgi:hypothetical protein
MYRSNTLKLSFGLMLTVLAKKYSVLFLYKLIFTEPAAAPLTLLTDNELMRTVVLLFDALVIRSVGVVVTASVATLPATLVGLFKSGAAIVYPQ